MRRGGTRFSMIKGPYLKALGLDCDLLRGAIIVYVTPSRSLRREVAVARRSRSKPGDSSLRSEQAPQSQGEIATPFGLAMTTFGIPNVNYFMLLVIMARRAFLGYLHVSIDELFRCLKSPA